LNATRIYSHLFALCPKTWRSRRSSSST
jgi:hypothetical protein